MEIRLYNPSDGQLWDEYVMLHPDATHCHLSGWKEIIEKAYGHKTYYLIAERSCGTGHSSNSTNSINTVNSTNPSNSSNPTNAIVGILPLVHIKSLIFGNLLVSMPFLNYGGVLADTPQATGGLLEQATKICSNLRASYIELRHLNPMDGLGPINRYNSFQKTDKVRMILKVPDSSEKLLKSFKAKLRSQILRPQKEGLKSFIGGEGLLDDFYRVFTVNMRDLGSPVHSKKLFQKILVHLEQNSKIGIVKYNNLPVAAGLILLFRDTVEILWASSLREYNRLSPNMLLYWSFLDYTCSQGFRYFDFGRSTPGGGTYKFKEQWGAESRRLYWNVYSRFNDYNQNSGDHSEWVSRAIIIWQYLPVFLTNFIGPRIRASIPL